MQEVRASAIGVRERMFPADQRCCLVHTSMTTSERAATPLRVHEHAT